MRTEKEIWQQILKEVDKTMTEEQKREMKHNEDRYKRSLKKFKTDQNYIITEREELIFNWGYFYGKKNGEKVTRKATQNTSEKINWTTWDKNAMVEEKQYLVIDIHNNISLAKPHSYEIRDEPAIPCWIREDKSVNFNVTHYAPISLPVNNVLREKEKKTNEFEFTFKVGDAFKHTFKSIERYVQKNVKSQEKLHWNPSISIQLFSQNTTKKLKEGLLGLNRMNPQSLYIQILNGTSLHDHLTFDIRYLSDEKVWVVESVQYPAALWGSEMGNR
jgi:hypothetical protein